MKGPPAPGRSLSLAKKLLFLAVILAAAGGVVEVGFRLFAPRLGTEPEKTARFREFVRTGESPYFEPRAFVSFVRRSGLPGVNAEGFVAPDTPRDRPPGTLRIACLGGSTTESLPAEGYEHSYPRILERLIRKSGRPDAQVLNFGVPAWTTAESMVNYFIRVQDYEPDVVVIHHAINDVPARMWPGFRDDYSHYRIPWNVPRFGFLYRVLVRSSDLFAFLAMRRLGEADVRDFVDRPVAEKDLLERPIAPETARAFRRNVRTVCRYVRLEGGAAVLATMPYNLDQPHFENHKRGIEEHNAILRDLARDEGFVLVDLAADARENWDAWNPEFVDIVHVTKEGNRRKASRIARALSDAGLLECAMRRR